MVLFSPGWRSHHIVKTHQVFTYSQVFTQFQAIMKTTLLTAAASAAPTVLKSHFPMANNLSDSTAVSYVFPPLLARYTGECEPLCEKYRPRNDCVSAGWQNNCFDACMSACLMIHESGTDSPSDSDLIIIMSEDSEWHDIDHNVGNDNSSGDERTEIPCMGWCRRSDNTTGSDSSTVNNTTVNANTTLSVDAAVHTQVTDLHDRVTAYAQIFHHLRRLRKPVETKHGASPPIGTRLDPFLKTWIAGFKNRLVRGEDLEAWYESLYRHVEQSEGPAGSAWAYRFELVAHKDSERELGEVIRGLRGEQRGAIVRAVHRLWKEEFGEA